MTLIANSSMVGNRTSRNTNRLPVPGFHDMPKTTSSTTADTAAPKQPPVQSRRNSNINSSSRPPKKPSATNAQQHTATATTRQTKTKTPAFRQKVSSANKTAICTTESHKVGRRTLRQLLHSESDQSTNTIKNKDTNTDTYTNRSVHEAYIVPIFQRRYCWTTPQWNTLWHDVLNRHSIHSLGRLTCTNVQSNNHDRSVIIDGQQRFTSVTLLLAAIRDSLVSLGIHFRDNGDLLQSIHEMLFLNPRAMEEWVTGSSTNSSSSTDNNSNEKKNSNNDAILEGMTLEFCRLVPTFCDRSAYLAAILPPSAPQVQKFLAETYNPRWHRPLLAKRHFASKIRSLLVSSQSSLSSPPCKAKAHEILKKLARSLLDGIDMLYFPIDVDRGYNDGTEDTQVVYERLAIRDATFCKPSRTSEYHSMDGTDMIRNLLLGSFGTPVQKTGFYETFWLPLERMFQTTGTKFDEDNGEDEENLQAVFRAFLEDQTHVASATAATGSMVIGGRIYHDFQNWMARDFERWENAACRDGSSPFSSPVEEHTRDVGKRLLGFATSISRTTNQHDVS